MSEMQQPFVWYELMTTDMAAAEAFYTTVVGWRAEPFPSAEMNYTVLNVGSYGVGGMMAQPPHLAQQKMPPAWVGYIYTPDVDKAAEGVKAAAGSLHRSPWDVPGVGRIAVVADPGGAIFHLMAPAGEAPKDRPAGDAPGMIGWRELYANDWEKAFAFYTSQFGWTKNDTLDMGSMGKYQLFTSGPDQMGGMMNRPPNIPASFWQFYFIVDDIDTATARVTDNGGTVLMGPMEVPGGGWIIQAMDPQGGAFALTGPRLRT